MLTRVTAKLSPRMRHLLRRIAHPARFGALSSASPVSTEWGFDRGTPVDRYYIERFLDEHRADIHGRVVEIRDSSYTHRFGDGVVQADVLDIDATNPEATIVADLTAADNVAGDQFDCFLLNQTLQFIYDTSAAITQAHRLLRSGGVLLVTVPVVSRIAPRYGLETDYWRFTAASAQRLFSDIFGSANVSVQSYGNVMAGIAFLRGVAHEELSRRRLDVEDPYFPIVIGVRAVKVSTH